MTAQVPVGSSRERVSSAEFPASAFPQWGEVVLRGDGVGELQFSVRGLNGPGPDSPSDDRARRAKAKSTVHALFSGVHGLILAVIVITGTWVAVQAPSGRPVEPPPITGAPPPLQGLIPTDFKLAAKFYPIGAADGTAAHRGCRNADPRADTPSRKGAGIISSAAGNYRRLGKARKSSVDANSPGLLQQRSKRPKKLT